MLSRNLEHKAVWSLGLPEDDFSRLSWDLIGKLNGRILLLQLCGAHDLEAVLLLDALTLNSLRRRLHNNDKVTVLVLDHLELLLLLLGE